MANGQPDVLDAAQQVIVLAFDLTEAEVKQLPVQIVEALQSPPVQNAVKKTLLDFAATKWKAGTTAVTDDEGRKLLTTLGTSVKDAASDALLSEVKKTPEFKRLERSVGAFQQAAAASALGVWVDRNKKILYVVGAALVLGTATVLYVTKTGGALVNKAVDPLQGKEFEVLQIGKLTLKAGLWDFQPDARVLGARVFATTHWEQVTLDLKLGVLAQGSEVQKIEGQAVVKSKAFSVAVTTDSKPAARQVNLGLKLGYDGRLGTGTFNIAVGALYQNEQLSGTLGASYKTRDVSFGLQGQAGPKSGGGVQYGGLLTMAIPID